MTIERILRFVAIAIAVLAIVDPPVTLESRTRPRVAIDIQDGPSMRLPSSSGRGTRGDEAQHAVDALTRDLRRDFEIANGVDTSAAAVIVAGDRYPDVAIPADVRVSTISVSERVTPNVRVLSVSAPRTVPAGTSVSLMATVEGAGVRNQETTLAVLAGGVEVARASHMWTNDDERWQPVMSAAPVGTAPYRFEILAKPLEVERTADDNRAVVEIGEAAPLRVLFYEARPSWASAFVRRAIETDPRFVVSGVSRPSPKTSVDTGPSPALPADRLDAFDVIAVGGVDGLSQPAIATLDTFMTERGGSVGLLPDARPAAAVSGRWFPGVTLNERLLETAMPLTVTEGTPRMDASELLEAPSLSSSASVLARSAASKAPVVWTLPVGDGRVLVSGAMDAWRYRAENGVEFDRFWRSAIAGLALAAKPAIDVGVEPGVSGSDQPLRATAIVRGVERRRLGNALSITGKIDGRSFRFWPDANAGHFSGSFAADRARIGQTLRVSAALGDGSATGSASALIDDSPREISGLPLSLLSASHHGVDVNASTIATLAQHLRTTVPAQMARVEHRPMRSVWWMFPFAGCLSAEWWLRRRSGRR